MFAVASRAYLGFVFSDCFISSLAIISLRREMWLLYLFLLYACTDQENSIRGWVGGLGPDNLFCHKRISKRGVKISLEKQSDPRGRPYQYF